MKKLLPIVGGLLIAGSSVAQAENTRYNGLTIMQVSANGEWGVHTGDGAIQLINFKTGDVYTNDGSDIDLEGQGFTSVLEDNIYVSAGYGHAVSDNGIVVGSITYNGNAAYWKLTSDAPESGEWLKLPVLSENGSTAHGITPDGKRIVGYTYRSGQSFGSDGIVCVPILWEANDEGGYDLKELPYPTKDFTGRTPQYITPLFISDDGHRIAGQVTDFSGFFHTMITFDEDANGNWTYAYVHPELQSLGYDFPEYYEYDGPSYPQQTNYMTEEEQEAFSTAKSNWKYGSGEPYPQAEDFMTEEELEAYNSAMTAYKTAHTEWEENVYDPFMELFWDVCEKAPDFLFNTYAMSHNGKYLGATAQMDEDDPDSWYGYSTVFHPSFFDLTTNEYTQGKDEVSITSIANDGTSFGQITQYDQYLHFAYAKTLEAESYVRLTDYVRTRSEEVATWMEDELTGPYYVGYDDEWNLIDDDDVLDGIPLCDKDANTIVGWTYDIYDDDDKDYYQFSYVINLPAAQSGIQSVAANADKSFGVSASRNGVIKINGDAASVNVYDLAGKLVYSNNAPAAANDTKLAAGVYVIKAVSTDGKQAVAKAVFAE